MAVNRSIIAAAMIGAAMHAGAQQFPSKPVRLVLPFPTGPGVVISQLLSEGWRESFRHGVIVDPRPGAGGALALEAVARAAPDGHTLLVTSPVLTIMPIIRPALKIDPLRDFSPISLVGMIPNLMAVHPSVPAKNLREFIREARSRPGKLTYGSSGVGSTNHLVTELLSNLAKIKMVHAPYKSNTFAALDLVRGDVDMLISVRTSMVQFIPNQKLRVIAILSAQRAADLPDVPTVVEQGLPDLVVVSYYGVLAPAGTLAEIIERLHHEVQRVFKPAEARKVLVKSDIDPVVGTTSEFAQAIRNDSAKWTKVVRDANLKFDER